MKIDLMLKTALVALFAFGAANAAQRVEVHPDYRGKPSKHLEVEASRLRNQVDHPSPAYIAAHAPAPAAVVAAHYPAVSAAANTHELINVAEGHMTLADYVDHAKARTVDHLNQWIDRDLLNPDGPFLHAGVANVAGLVPFVGNRHARHGAPAFAANTQPADLTRDAFKTALGNFVNALTLAELQVAEPALLAPADASIEALSALNTNFKQAVEVEILDWVDNLLAPNAQFLDNGVANDGTGGHGAAVAVPVGGVPANRPVGNWRDDFAVKLQEIIAQSY